MLFFTFRQNNSGGYLDIRPEEGIGSTVCIEATDAEAANAKAREIGITFGMLGSCECCGERWMEVDEYDGMPFPHKYGHLIWTKDHRTEPSFIHYSNGTIVRVDPSDKAPQGWQQVYAAYIIHHQRTVA